MKTQKLTQEELQQIKTIQENTQSVILELGQIELLKIELEDRVQNAKTFLKELREEETTLAQFLQSTYGKGSINLEQGEFIPFEEVE